MLITDKIGKREIKESFLKFSNKMKFLKQKDGFLGYEANTTIKSKVVVVPFGLEKTVSYGGGTKNEEVIFFYCKISIFANRDSPQSTLEVTLAA